MVRLIACVMLCFVTPVSLAGGPDPEKGGGPEPAAFVRYPDAPATTVHQVTVAGKTIRYVATAGTITMVNDEQPDKPSARVFSISYRVTNGLRQGADLEALADKILTDDAKGDLARRLALPGVDADEARLNALLAAGVHADDLFDFPDPAARPVTFSFNGGPGSSSVWLHLGLFGPRRIDYADDFGNPGPPPYRLTTNETTLLDVSDFVFIDPVSTGFSRTEGDTSPNEFHGVNADIGSVAEFIRRWLGANERWASPKFIAGESYGTTRAAGLSRALLDRHGIAVDGIVLISTVLNFQTISFDVGNDLPPVLYLPSYCAAAHFHGRLDPSLQNRPLSEAVAEAEAFAQGEYAGALLRGTSLPEPERQRIAERVAHFTGLTPEYVLRTDLRVTMPRFPKELLRDEGLTIGRFDARYTAADRDDAGESPEFDPSYAAVQSIYTETFNDYVRRELGYGSDLPYQVLTNVWPWSFRGRGDNQYTNVADDLRGAMQRVPSMRVFVACGLYDLATPVFATDYTVNHLMLREDLRSNVEVHDYEAGHMMYLHRPSREKLSADLHAFYRSVLDR